MIHVWYSITILVFFTYLSKYLHKYFDRPLLVSSKHFIQFDKHSDHYEHFIKRHYTIIHMFLVNVHIFNPIWHLKYCTSMQSSCSFEEWDNDIIVV